MAEWKKRAKISADVVHFPYVRPQQEGHAEEIFVWDLDKTYLDTKVESLKGLLRTIAEKAYQKKNVPGTAALVRSLKAQWANKHSDLPFPIYFITASPPQIEEKIIYKLNLDNIQPFGIFCKDNLRNLRPKRLWRLTQQVGYKLQALLQMRLNLSEDVRLILWGDDSESDVTIYCLYSDICARRLDEDKIRHILKSLKVTGPQLGTILSLQSAILKQDPVEKIYINLAEDTDAEYYLKFGRRVLATYNSFQTALDLCQDQRIEDTHVIEVAKDLLNNFGFTTDELERSYDDLIRRRVLSEKTVLELTPLLEEAKIIDPEFKPSVAPRVFYVDDSATEAESESDLEPWIPNHIDYLHDYR